MLTLIRKLQVFNAHGLNDYMMTYIYWYDWLYDTFIYFHEWKLIPLHLINLIKSTFRINFHSNLDFDDSKILTFPSFYKQFFRNWHKYLSSSVNISSSILSQLFWYNNNIWYDKTINPFLIKNLPQKKFLYDLFYTENELKMWNQMKVSNNLSDDCYFAWSQIISSIKKKKKW